MSILRYFLIKLKTAKKLTILGVVFLSFSVIAIDNISRALLVDMLTDAPVEKVEIIPEAQPLTETTSDTHVVTAVDVASVPVAEEVVPVATDIPADTSTTPIADAEPAVSVIALDCEPEVALAEAITPVEALVSVEVPAPVDAPVEIPVTEVSTEIPTPAEEATPIETPIAEVVTPTDTPAETSTVAVPVEEIITPTAPVCIPKQAAPSTAEPIIEATPVKKVEPAVPFVDLYVPEVTTEKEVVIDSMAVQSCTAESFVTEIQGGHSQIIPLLLRGSGSSDNSVKIGDVPKGSILSFVANGLTEITGISFENLMISADIASDAQKGSFNVPIIYSITSKNEVSNAMCQLNLVIQ